MAIRTRQFLKQEFQDGARPSGADFADLMDSFVNPADDGVTVDGAGNVVLQSGLGLGDSNRTQPGTLRFHQGAVQFHDGANWVSLASGSGGAFQPVGVGGAVAYAGGNVGVGTFLNPPTHRLEVELGPNATEADRVRFGNAVCSNGSAAFQTHACFSHRNRANNSDFALRQGPNGNVELNSASGQPVSLRQGGTTVALTVSANGNTVVRSANELAGAGAAVLQVNGEAFKTGISNVWTVASDLRLKEDIRELELGLEQLVQVRPVRFRYNGQAGTTPGRECIGIIGQELEEIFPEMIQRVLAEPGDSAEIDDLRIYDGSALTFVLVNAVKELAAKVRTLEAQLRDAAQDGESRD